MQVFFDQRQKIHAPETMMFRGQRIAFPECPERLDLLQSGLASIDLKPEPAQAHDLTCLTAVHDPGYVDFLQNGFAAWSELDNASPEIIPNTHPGRHMRRRPTHIVGLAGYYMGDQACPVGPDTWSAVAASADSALSAVDVVAAGAEVAYGLCRPPGHHAFADMAGGFCYLNNVAIAAQRALDSGAKKVAILDIDVHHGNGTQSIFYQRSDVLFVSLHGDPNGFYPFFSGYQDETGAADGNGYNMNLPLPSGTGDAEFLAVLETGLNRIDEYRPEMLLISLGLDTQADDPLGIFEISRDGFSRLGARIANRNAVAGRSAAIIQEGGYVCDLLGENLACFLSGYADGQSA